MRSTARFLLVGVVLLAVSAVEPPLEARFGAPMGALFLVPLAFAALFGGVPGGALVGLLVVPLRIIAGTLEGYDGFGSLLGLRAALGAIATVAIGGGLGLARDRARRSRDELGRLAQERAALAQDEERFREFAERIDAVFWAADPGLTRTTYVSPAFERIWGRSAADVTRDPRVWLDAIHPDDRERVTKALEEAARENAAIDLDYRILRAEHAIRWIHHRSYPVRDASGVLLRYVGIAEDVTSHREAEASAREGEARMRSLVDSTFDGIVIHRDGVILEANAAFAKMFGYAVEELRGTSVFDLAAPEMQEVMRAHVASSEDASYTITMVHKGGERREVDVLARSAPFGGVLARVTAVRDVTEKRRADERLRAQRERYEQLLAALSKLGEGILLLEGERVIFANAAAAGLTECSVEELTALASILALVAPEDTERAAVELASLLSGERASTLIELDVIARSGRRVPVEVVATLSDTSEGPRVTAVFRDLTERKRAKAAMEASQIQMVRNEKLFAIGTLVAGVAHEINNPLSYMKLRSEDLRDVLVGRRSAPDVGRGEGAALDAAIEDARVLLDGIARIGKITSSLKRIARTSEEERKPEDLNGIVEGVLAMTATGFGGPIAASLELSATRPVLGSATELSQVVLNLVINALDAMKKHETGTLTVRTFDEGANVVVEVGDTGDGVPPEIATHVFTPFFTTKPSGTGLGLSVSHRIVVDHGGTLTFRSEPGQGTTFRVAIPAAAQGSKLPEVGPRPGEQVH